MADFVNEYISIRAWYSKVNFSDTHKEIAYIKDMRSLKKYTSGEAGVIKTDVKYLTTLYPNSYEFVKLQSKKSKKHEVEITFKENIDVDLFFECEKLTLVTRDDVDIPCNIVEKSIEMIADSSIYSAIFTFEEIIADAQSLNSFVESSVVATRLGANDIYLQIWNDVNIDSENLITGIKFYTIFYPIVSRETIGENKEMSKTATGEKFTIQNYTCKTVTIKLFLSDINLAIFKKYIHNCFFYDSSGNPRGINVYDNGNNYASQSVNSEDVQINENDSLINMTEVDITIKLDFLRTDK